MVSYQKIDINMEVDTRKLSKSLRNNQMETIDIFDKSLQTAYF